MRMNFTSHSASEPVSLAAIASMVTASTDPGLVLTSADTMILLYR